MWPFKPRKCKHVFTGYHGSLPYVKIASYNNTDGIGRTHLTLTAQCDKCGKDIPYAKMHAVER